MSFQQANVGICSGDFQNDTAMERKLGDMETSSSKDPGVSRALRWDRIGLVALILVGCSSGMVALVGGTEAEDEEFTRLTHPKPVVALQPRSAHPLLLTSDAPAEEAGEDDAALPEEVDEFPAEPVAPEEVADPTPEPNVEPEAEEDKSLPRKNILPCSCCRKTMHVPKNPYTAHQSAARALPNSFFVKNDIELKAGQRNGKLVKVENGRGYHVDRLTHSHPWLLPETFRLLQDMGNDYVDALEGTKSEGASFRVTPVTRTNKQQRKLARRNANATNSTSTHSYGASFDIAFIDRDNTDAGCGTPTREMERLLNRYQKAGIIYVIPEGNCMHITLRKPS